VRHDNNVPAPSLAGFARHEHAGLIYETAEERLSSLTDFIKAGLDRNEHCRYFHHGQDVSALMGSLAACGVDVEKAVQTGALSIKDAEGWFFGDETAGELLESAVEEMADKGFMSLRVAGEMAYQPGNAPTAGWLLEQRATLQKFFAGNKATGLFLYDCGLPGNVLLEAINTHPLILYRGILCKNFYFSPPQEAEGPAIPYIRVERLLNSIMGHHKAERAIMESEEKYRTLMNDAGDAIILADFEGNLLDCNRKARELFGYSGEELVRMNFHNLHPEEGLPKAVMAFHHAIQNGSGRFDDLLIKRKDGAILPVEVTASAVEYGGRKVLHGVFHDITERKRVEAALRENEELYRQMFESTKAITLLADPVTGEIVDANAAAEEFYGYAKDDLRRMKISYINTMPQDELREEMAKAAREERNYFHFKQRLASGEPRDVEVYSSPVSVGGRTLLYSIIHDITRRKKAEEALMESEERYRGLVEMLPEAVVVHSGGAVVFANAAAVSMMRVESPKELLGKPVLDFVHPDFRAEVLGRIKLMMVQKEVVPLAEEKFVRPDGSVMDVEAVGMPIVFEGKVAVLAVFREITDRKRAEQALLASKATLDSAQRIAHVGNWDWEPVSGRLVWSDELYRICGLKPQEVPVTRELAEQFIHPHDLDRVTGELNAALTGERPFRMEYRMVLKDGSIKVVYSQAEVTWDAGKNPVRMMGILQDITGRKAVEDELVAAKEAAENATRVKDKFVSLVSHDLKGPLASMTGFLRIIHDDNADVMLRESKEMLAMVMDTGKKMSELIENLLDISRLKTGKVPLNRRFLDGYFLVEKVIASLNHLAARKEVGITNSLPPRMRIFADYALLCQVVENLISNSIKFCNKGDRITIFAPEGRRSTMAVADTGVGMSAAQIETLFNYDVKTSTTGTAGEIGTGLGLPLCYDILRAHGGVLETASEPGKGSTIRIVLPYVRPSVLLVDDDRLSLKMVGEVLKDCDFDLFTAVNGAEALAVAASKTPHLIITDVYMPDMDGYDLVKELRNSPLLKNIPVIAITGKFGRERERMLQLGADDFVAKQNIIGELLPRISKYIP